MTSPFPLDAWAKPGKDAFEFWISFFPTAPLFGVEWRFADMASPAMNPFMQAGATPFMMPFPAMRAAGAAARPGEMDTPARADEKKADPVAQATEVAAGAASDAGRVVAETGSAAVQTAERAVTGGGTAAEMARAAQKRSAADHGGEAPGNARKIAARTGKMAADSVAAGGKGAASTDLPGSVAEQFKAKAEARATTPKTATTALDAAASAAAKGVGAKPAAVEAAIAAGPRPAVLLSQRPDDADDLTSLKGVGAGLAKQLNELGLYKLEQLATMSQADLAWIDAKLPSFRGRCFRDDWIGQAKARMAK